MPTGPPSTWTRRELERYVIDNRLMRRGHAAQAPKRELVKYVEKDRRNRGGVTGGL